MLRSAVDHHVAQTRLSIEALRAMRRARGRSLSYKVGLVSDFQQRAMREAVAAVGLMLAEQRITAPAEATVLTGSLEGWASDGRDMAGLVEVATAPTVRPDVVDTVMLTQVADAGRFGAALAMATRPRVTRYVRMVQAGACSRCAILAGREYRSQEAFDRHPRCNCVHIPSTEALAGDATTDPNAYFDSLSAAEQDRTFTKAGAEAIRLGADPIQVVNARAGMSTAQVAMRGVGDRWTASGRLVRTKAFGRDVYTTTEGMTKRGTAYRVRGGKSVRLMPESIIELADSPAERTRLLKAHGYIA
jgi:hypothetical protein